jgi:hypothetical protein
LLFSGTAGQRRLWSPCPRGFLISHDVPQSVGLLWTSDQLAAETSTCQHTAHITNIHALGGIRTHDRSRRAAAELHLRPRGHWDRPFSCIMYIKLSNKIDVCDFAHLCNISLILVQLDVHCILYFFRR